MNLPNNLEGGLSKTYTIEEFVDLVDADLTMDCALPRVLPLRTIQRITETIAKPWFYQNYRYALQKAYYFIDKRMFETEHFTRYKWIYLPPEVQNVIWLYKIENSSLFQLGINSPNLSVNLGTSNNAYLQSYVTTIGELGVYKTIIDSFSDMLNQLSLYTIKHDYNQMSNRLNILTGIKTNVIAEVYANIESEHLYADPLFLKYVTGMAKIKLGEQVGRYDFTLPGEVKYNSGELKAEGNEVVKEVEEYIRKIPNSDFFYLVKR